MSEDTERKVGFSFDMPIGADLEIRASKFIDDDFQDHETPIEGVVYRVYWGDLQLPWFSDTESQAHIVALGCQFGAYEMYERMSKKI